MSKASCRLSMPGKQKAVTLVELLLAIILFVVLVIGVGHIQIFSRFHVFSADRRAKTQNDASVVLAHMQRQIVRAIGNSANSPFAAYNDNRGIRIRVDNNPVNGQVDATDTWIGYRHVGNQILFCPSGAGADASCTDPVPNQVVGTHIVTTNLADPPENWGLRIDIIQVNQLDVTVRARWNTALAASPDNPEVTLRNTIIAPAVSTN